MSISNNPNPIKSEFEFKTKPVRDYKKTNEHSFVKSNNDLMLLIKKALEKIGIDFEKFSKNLEISLNEMQTSQEKFKKSLKETLEIENEKIEQKTKQNQKQESLSKLPPEKEIDLENADFFKKDANGDTILMKAARKNDPKLNEQISKLLFNNIKVSTAMKQQRQELLYLACEHGNIFFVDSLLNFCGANPNDYKSKTESSPLILAAQGGHHEIVESLLENGANPNYVPLGQTETAKEIAEKNNDSSLVQIFERYEKEESIQKWKSRNENNCLFAHKQSYEHIPDSERREAYCMATTYRWLRRLPKLSNNPDLRINAGHLTEYQSITPSKLNLPSDNPNEASRRDRFEQTQFRLAFTEKFSNQEDSDPTGLMKKHNMRERPLDVNAKSPKILFEQLERNKTLLNDSKGCAFITAQTAQKGAHALMIQIDEDNNIYRFGDVNEGMFQYNSKKQLQVEFERYMETHYTRDERILSFEASQIIPNK